MAPPLRLACRATAIPPGVGSETLKATHKPSKPTGHDSESGLPHPPEEFRAELLRRLELLEREIRALDSEETHQAFLSAIDTLRTARRGLESRLEAIAALEGWRELRVELVAQWREYRREFEKLAAAWHRRFPARPGQGQRGPKW